MIPLPQEKLRMGAVRHTKISGYKQVKKGLGRFAETFLAFEVKIH